MTTIPRQTKRIRQIGLTLAEALAGLGITVAFAAGPALASDQKVEESYEKHDSGRVESKLYGTVQKIPFDRIGYWTVNGRTIMVTKETRIREEYGKAVVGAYVEVEGANSDKNITAHKIEVKRAKM
jgi:hypothetical protein